MPPRSAGLLMYRRRARRLEVLLVHPGGPLFAKKSAGHWGIPKGLIDSHEAAIETAVREFEEETSFEVEAETFLPLGEVRLESGKRVLAWAFEGSCDPSAVESNEFEMEWPPNSGNMQAFPEVDRAEWFDLPRARSVMNEAQAAFLDRLNEFAN